MVWKGRIRCKGNLFAKFMEYTDVEVDGFVEADSAINCNVVSNDKAIFNGDTQEVSVEKYTAVQALRCKTWVMMPLSRPEVHVGVHKKIKIKIAELEKLKLIKADAA